jgi:hypothetical protein
MLRHGQTKRGGSVGSAPLRGGAVVCPGRIPGGGRPGIRGDRGRSAPMVPGVAGSGQGGLEGGRPVGAQADAGRGAAGPARYGPAPWPVGPWVPDGSLDAAPDRHGPRAADGGPAPSRTRVAAPAEVELVAPTAGPAGARTGRTGDSAVGAGALAPGKKNARRRHAWLVFQDESGLSQLRSSAAPGRPGARPPS